MRCPTLNELPQPPLGKTGWPWTKDSPQLPDTLTDSQTWPKMSIVTPSYNQGLFIEETIRSVLLQGYPDMEYIIIDGGSNDGSVDTIRRYEDSLAYWVSEADKGQSDAINKGWKGSSGEIVAWINADDTYCPGVIRAIGEMFRDNHDIVLVSGAGNIVDVDGRTIISIVEPPDINPYVILKRSGGIPCQPSVFLRKSVLDEVGFLNTRLHYVMDLEFWIRIALHYGPEQLAKTNMILSNYRQWSETKTNKAGIAVCQEKRQVFDYIFREFSHDKRLLQIRRSAYSASYRAQAVCARENEDTVDAIRSLFRAWLIAPLGCTVRGLLFLVSILSGSRGPNR